MKLGENEIPTIIITARNQEKQIEYADEELSN
jgi:hypothetical protein